MLWLQNELGWRLYKNSAGYTIRRAQPTFSRRIPQFGPVFLTVFYAAFLWLVGDNEKLRIALFVIPLSLVLGYYLFRPAVLYINIRRRLVMAGGFFHSLPFSRCKIEVDHGHDSGYWKVYLKDTEPLLKTSQWQSGIWECLVWESATEAEASDIAEEFRRNGIGIKFDQEQDQTIKVIKADKQLRKLILAGYLMSVTVLVVWVGHLINSVGNGEIDPDLLLRIIKTTSGFIFLSILVFCIYICRFGWRAISYRKIPPPRTTVVIDTKVVEGNKAAMLGWLLIGIAIILFFLGLLIELYIPYKLENMFWGN